MTETAQPEPQPLGGATDVTPWQNAREQLAAGNYYWLATVRSNGQPHVRPLLGVWYEDALYFCSSVATRKTENLTSSPECSIATETDMFHFVVEGETANRRDEITLQDVAGAYATKYGWNVEIRDGAFHAEGAPTAGEPPYDVYELTPKTVFGFGLDSSVSATRWQFSQGP